MALIKCSECGKEISDKADACPSCGNPIHHTAPAPAVPVQKIEIEQTNKKWKGTGCFAVILAFIGLMTLSKSMGLGIGLIVLALVISFIARAGAWWDNG